MCPKFSLFFLLANVQVYSDARLNIMQDASDADHNEDEDYSDSDSESDQDSIGDAGVPARGTGSRNDKDEDLFHLRRSDHDLDHDEHIASGTKSRKQKKRERSHIRPGAADDGADVLEVQDWTDAPSVSQFEHQHYLQQVDTRIKIADVADKIHEHERVKELHQKHKQAEKLKTQRTSAQSGIVAELGAASDDDDDDDDDFHDDLDGEDDNDVVVDQADAEDLMQPHQRRGKRKSTHSGNVVLDSESRAAKKRHSNLSLHDSEQLALQILASRR